MKRHPHPPAACVCRDCLPDALPRGWPAGTPFSSDLWPQGDATAVIVSPLLCTDTDVLAAREDAGAVLRQQMEELAKRVREADTNEALFEPWNDFGQEDTG